MTRTQMGYWLASITGIISLLFGIHAILADEPLAESNDAIVLGMKVNVAQKILKKLKIEESIREYSMAKDTDWLFHRLSREVGLVFAYSKTSRKITGIALFYGYPPYCKGDDVMVSARSIRFEKDGSYVVHCENPKRNQESRASVQAVTPSLPPASFQPPMKSESPPMKYMPPTPTHP